MKNWACRSSVALLLLLAAACHDGGVIAETSSTSAHSATAPLTTAEARELAQQAYIVAYAPVANYAKQSPYALDKSSYKYVGPNQQFKLPLLFNTVFAEASGVPSPSNDLLYSTGTLDLRAQPVVVSAGPVSDPERYYTLQIMDLDTNILYNISTLTNNNKGGHYLVLGPDNTQPADTSDFTAVIHSPSQIDAIVGRVQARNELDQINAIPVQSNFQIQTLSAYRGTPAPQTTVPALPVYDEGSAQGLGFLRYANLVFGLQPLADTDPELAARLQRIHVGAGQTFSAADFSKDIQDAIAQGLADGAKAVSTASLSSTGLVNGWATTDAGILSDDGSYGRHYLGRAAVAYSELYLNTRSEAWYGTAYVDGDGATLTGSKQYVLHFAADALPPARFFWSVTAYDVKTHEFFLAVRYKISSTSPGLAYNADGSLDIPISAIPPLGINALTNWLPVGGSPFYLFLRLYGPGESVLDGSWQPPAVMAVQ